MALWESRDTNRVKSVCNRGGVGARDASASKNLSFWSWKGWGFFTNIMMHCFSWTQKCMDIFMNIAQIWGFLHPKAKILPIALLWYAWHNYCRGSSLWKHSPYSMSCHGHLQCLSFLFIAFPYTFLPNLYRTSCMFLIVYSVTHIWASVALIMLS